MAQVHAMKKSKKGDEERSEEFSRVYELPTEKDVDPSKVTSSIYQDGVLTIELPVADALGQPPQAQWAMFHRPPSCLCGLMLRHCMLLQSRVKSTSFWNVFNYC